MFKTTPLCLRFAFLQLTLCLATGMARSHAADVSAPADSGRSPELRKLVERMREVVENSPRDAEKFFELGQAFKSEGQAERANWAFEQAVRIDPDHPGARQELGYRRQGAEWTKGPRVALKPVPAEGEAAPESTASQPAQPAPQNPAAGGGATAPAVPKEKGPPGGSAGSSPASPAEAKTEAAKVEERIAARKRWAQEAGEKLQMKFSFVEDEDFLIHSNFESGSGKVKALHTSLKGIKRLVQKFIGSHRGPIWPDKQQIVYLQASTQCMRFAEAIDSQRFPEEDGVYTAGDEQKGFHTVFSTPREAYLAEYLGWSALDRLGGSNRFVGWWLRDGIGGLVKGATEEGKRERTLDQAFSRVAAELEARFDEVSIFKLLETEDYKPNAAELNRALATTFVMYLYEKGGGKLHQVIAALKSPEAPSPPAGDDKLFFSKYIAFQANVLTTAYHEKTEKMNDGWKAYVQQKAALVDKAPKPPEPGKTNKTGKTTKGTKGTGGKDGGDRPPEKRGGGDRRGGNEKKGTDRTTERGQGRGTEKRGGGDEG